MAQSTVLRINVMNETGLTTLVVKPVFICGYAEINRNRQCGLCDNVRISRKKRRGG